MEKQMIFQPGSLSIGPNCHASNLIVLPDNRLMGTWWSASYEKSPDGVIYTSFWNEKGEEKWSKPVIAANNEGHFNGTPVPYLSPEGKLFLFSRCMYHGKFIKGGHTTTNIQYRISNDLGKTWGGYKYLRKLWVRVIRCKAKRLKSGRVIMPFHRELFTYQSRFYINEDPELQEDWQTVGRLRVKGGCLEPSICIKTNGNILCGMRTFKAKYTYFSESMDEGSTWSDPTPSKVPNPNSQVDLISLNNGHILMACNPLTEGRSELSIIRSLDGGHTWDLDNKYILEREKGCKFSYPCLIQDNNGLIHLSYTYKRKSIAHFTFLEDELYS